VQSWREKPRSRINGRHPPPLALTPRQCSWLLTNKDHPRVTDEQRGFLGRLSERCPTVAAAQELSLAFCHLVRERREGALIPLSYPTFAITSVSDPLWWF